MTTNYSNLIGKNISEIPSEMDSCWPLVNENGIIIEIIDSQDSGDDNLIGLDENLEEVDRDPICFIRR